MPRKTSVQTAAMIRSGRNTGARSPRMSAMTRASTRMQGLGDQEDLDVQEEGRRSTIGRGALNSAPLKKVSLTAGHPGAETTTTARTPKATTVLADASQLSRSPAAPQCSARTGSTYGAPGR